MFALPTLLNALTKRTAGKADCSCSISELCGPVKNSRTPSVGGFAAIGFVVSMTTSRPGAQGLPRGAHLQRPRRSRQVR
jgi:hypothetical protein